MKGKFHIGPIGLICLISLINLISCEPNKPEEPPKVDTITILDTVFVLDTLLVTDTIPVVDTLFVDSVVPVTLNCVCPPYLGSGDTVAIISPSYYTPMTTINSACNVLRNWGFVPVVGPNVGKVVDGKYGGTPEERASDFMWAWNDPSIKAIICSRGGYGSIQLIDLLSLDELQEQSKWLVGYSDISTFHGLLNRAGVMSIHGTMATFFPSGSTGINCTMMRDLLLGQVPQYEVPVHGQNINGTATGILVGGNVCTFAPNVGTIADATLGQDLILFVEEVGESMHNIDRQLRILQLNGVFDRCKGVILGEFANCGTDFTDENGNTMSVEKMIHRMIAPYGIPLLCGFPAGHGNTNLPLVMGAPVTIDVKGLGSTITFNIPGNRYTVITSRIAAPARPYNERLRLAGKIE